ncbi:MAG TPA: hypothetical protein VHL53_21275 [Acidimicrobiia bacterium]|nr:hypothetical protein [Acidimicrobiia bacterium]
MNSTAATQTAAFYRDARRSLSHLLVHLPQQSQLFRELLGGKPVNAGTAGLVTGWANDYATARDLVGRVPAPVSAEPARDLYRLGAALYVESARTLAGAGGTADQVGEVRAARRLQLLGDTAFDAGHRLVLPATDGGEITVDRPAPVPVPDFAAAGVAPPDPAPPRAAPPDDRGALLSRIAELSGRTSVWLTGGAAVPGGYQAAAGELRGLVAAMVPAGEPTVDDSTSALALSALVDAEALRNPTVSDGARRLHLIAAGLWSVGRELAGRGSGPAGAVPSLPSSGLDPALLDAGGLFNGHPPPLRPGESPDKDVPGGFPSLSGVLAGGG